MFRAGESHVGDSPDATGSRSAGADPTAYGEGTELHDLKVYKEALDLLQVTLLPSLLLHFKPATRL